MSYPLLVALLLCPAAVTLDDKIDAKLLVGKWEPDKLPNGVTKIVVEFTKDEKLTIELEVQGNKQKLEGTYKVEGSNLIIKMKREGEERTQTRKLTKLTENEFVGKDEATGEESTMKKVK